MPAVRLRVVELVPGGLEVGRHALRAHRGENEATGVRRYGHAVSDYHQQETSREANDRERPVQPDKTVAVIRGTLMSTQSGTVGCGGTPADWLRGTGRTN
jgi:hypothetical protein